eukprot:gene36554-49254_t
MDELEKVFFKALDESMNSVDENDLNKCFADLPQLGNRHNKIFMNMIYKAQTNMIHRFKEICIKHKVESTIAETVESSPTDETDEVQKSLQKLANDAKRKEVEWLQNDCEQLQKKIRVLSASSLKKGNKINEMLDSQLE